MIPRITLVLLALAPARAFADAKADAQAHIEKATKAHEGGKLDIALNELNIAYTLDPQPELLFAIAQVHVQLGHCPEAITFYKRFLATHPPEDAVDVVNQAIETCKSSPPPIEQKPDEPPPPPPVEPKHDAPPPPPVAVPQPVDQPPFYTDTIGDAIVGAGVASGIVGAIFYATAQSALSDAEHATSYDASKALVDKAHTRRALAVGFEIGALGLVAGGIVHYMLRGPAGADTVTIAPAHGGATIGWSGRF